MHLFVSQISLFARLGFFLVLLIILHFALGRISLELGLNSQEFCSWWFYRLHRITVFRGKVLLANVLFEEKGFTVLVIFFKMFLGVTNSH